MMRSASFDMAAWSVEPNLPGKPKKAWAAAAISGGKGVRTVFDFAAKRAELAPEAIAFEEAESGRRITFAAFNERAERGAAALERMGVAAGERVAILCHNSTTFFEVLFALRQGGRNPGAAQLAPDAGGAGADPGRLRRAPAAARCGHGASWPRALAKVGRRASALVLRI